MVLTTHDGDDASELFGLEDAEVVIMEEKDRVDPERFMAAIASADNRGTLLPKEKEDRKVGHRPDFGKISY